MRHLTVLAAAVAVSACAGLPPMPTGDGSPPNPSSSPSPSPVAASPSGLRPSGEPTSSPGAGTAGPPRLIIRNASDGGVEWTITTAGSPERRTPLRVPIDDAQLGPARADGAVLLTTGGRVIVARVVDDELKVEAATTLPAGLVPLPACFAGDGRPVLADPETLALFSLTDAGAIPFTDVPFTLGECAPLADGRTLVAVDGGGLVAVGPGLSADAFEGLRGRHPSAGGGLLALSDRSSEAGEVTVLVDALASEGRLGPSIARVTGRGAERLVDASLSPDGRWLVVSVVEDGDGGRAARLRLYTVTPTGLVGAGEAPVALGADITVLPVAAP